MTIIEDEKQVAIYERIALANNQKIKLQEQIDKDGGQIVPGLYHGKRRVRARLSPDGWFINSTEEDLRLALGTERIHVKVNHVDLKNKYGLIIQDEIAPVEVQITEYGHINIKRTDEWGEGAKPYIDPTPWYKKLRNHSFKEIFLVTLFFPMLCAGLLSDKVGSQANQLIFIALFIASMIAAYVIGNPHHTTNTEILMILLCGLYASSILIPFWLNGFNVERL